MSLHSRSSEILPADHPAPLLQQRVHVFLCSEHMHVVSKITQSSQLTAAVKRKISRIADLLFQGLLWASSFEVFAKSPFGSSEFWVDCKNFLAMLAPHF